MAGSHEVRGSIPLYSTIIYRSGFARAFLFFWFLELGFLGFLVFETFEEIADVSCGRSVFAGAAMSSRGALGTIMPRQEG